MNAIKLTTKDQKHIKLKSFKKVYQSIEKYND